MSQSKYLQIAFDPQFEFYNNVRKLKSYHEECIKVLSAVEESDLEEMKDKFAAGEILIPKRPIYGLAKLLELIPSKSPNLEKLHSKLVSLLVSNFDTSDFVLPDKKDGKAVFSFLTKCSDIIKKQKAKQFFIYAAFGLYLEIHFKNFNKDVNESSWSQHVKNSFKISESHARDLRMVGKLVDTYPKLQNLSIAFRDFKKLRKQIQRLMETEEYKMFWKGEEMQSTSF